MKEFGAEVRFVVTKELLTNPVFLSRIKRGNYPGVVDRHVFVLVVKPEFHQHGTVICELQLIELVGEVQLHSRGS